jgi:hypothetical protein
MRRRQWLGLCGGAAVAALAGCTGDDGTDETPTDTATRTETSTPSPTPSPTVTGAGGELRGTLRYTVTNGDDTAHRVEVTLTTADGTPVGEPTEESLPADERLFGQSTGNEPDRGPYELTVALQSTSVTVEWAVPDCPDIDIGVAITDDRRLSVERETCRA